MSLCAGGNCCIGRVRHYSKRDTFSVPTGVHQSANAGRVLLIWNKFAVLQKIGLCTV
jgi:hypothetical protein